MPTMQWQRDVVATYAGTKGGKVKVIIAGSRDITDAALLEAAIKESGFAIDQVIEGGARGVDRLAVQWARRNHVPHVSVPADWENEGKAAGIMRNLRMAQMADALIAVWDNKSRGTKHMIDTATKRGLRVFVLNTGQSTKE